ncbi:MAG: tRNA (adenosine(37)-N6)-threonylcarbamoyltransferase complex transferase subunit TsaD [Microcoleus sp. PH2017_29_MFU_D_A]|jgi:N6-L-threonylcarbamoyladenine synthase|uniref:tRNA (adenosine(37)-N6)-threonylcarbamoyltransferase complex transferase subunit TsaD n=1 Tax=unclassified Microcoleus TaxID=2642155 RepID=UPI001DF88D42|nr:MULTISPECIES: tRNA (adenosine(37)-N6)-threonylcarbamoyltransferase complex transferase subunit TsaD [unclassified Microcoleus]MCC3417743.1 tRNA (adenosine(37)-N6)-threonylcarbamoyltransferase complex transferase subunit TsaD [Microcoleus sp. PH2017_07_MST_O_A]MCC3429064.1 tRNA (adenosine(37)-N6)-threonylcarbamoyltransferase complex transferase subunit TsaD [Microcoleus sp. PH2017_04_SCI_O_A]MCC3441413.1 tRNA (adenosine(37)-N6)-threonylcarbamoyltransferase complex transferase subunit TsaD [Mic
MATIFAIETSCDETAAAIVKNRQVCSNVVASQIKIHEQYGGVVPEVASRSHLEMLNQVIAQCLSEANLSWSEIDGIAATCAPGLVGALLVGLTAAKSLAIVHQKPFLGVHHLEGHIYASYLIEPDLQPPFLCLLVSGGHTSLIYVKDCGVYETVGQTRDDAAGEAFDKVARLLQLGYPGGPLMDKLAALGNPQAYPLPEGRISLPGGGYHPYDSSFSGLKTAVLQLVQKLKKLDINAGGEGVLAASTINDIAASFQETVAKGLTKRAIDCALNFGLTTIVVGGGVAANSGLRKHLQAAAVKHNLRVLFPPLKYCTDNAAMIGCAAAEHFQRGHTSPLTLGANSRMAVSDIMELYNLNVDA